MYYSKFIKTVKSSVATVVAEETTLDEIIKESYQDIEDGRIATIIKEHHEIKVTNTLIESYKELAASRIFTVDPIVQEIRKLNKLDSIKSNL